MKQKYFAPIEMLYNILKVCYDIYLREPNKNNND